MREIVRNSTKKLYTKWLMNLNYRNKLFLKKGVIKKK